jgi:hypothetical protein
MNENSIVGIGLTPAWPGRAPFRTATGRISGKPASASPNRAPAIADAEADLMFNNTSFRRQQESHDVHGR